MCLCLFYFINSETCIIMIIIIIIIIIMMIIIIITCIINASLSDGALDLYMFGFNLFCMPFSYNIVFILSYL